MFLKDFSLDNVNLTTSYLKSYIDKEQMNYSM